MIRKLKIRQIEKMNDRKWLPWEKDWRRWDRMVKCRDKLMQIIMWSMILGLLIEAFLIFAISGFLQIQVSSATTDGEFFGALFGYFSVLVVYTLPIIFVVFLINKPLGALD